MAVFADINLRWNGRILLTKVWLFGREKRGSMELRFHFQRDCENATVHDVARKTDEYEQLTTRSARRCINGHGDAF